jgi:hypothetical protein
MEQRKHTLESCKESASRYKTRIEWQKGDLRSYSSAQYNGWIDKCCINMIPLKRTHTFESCKEIASKYKYRKEWAKNHNSSYRYAYKNDWLDECCANMELKRLKRTLEDCKKIASQFKTRNEWRIKESNSYQYAWKNGWLDECCANMFITKMVVNNKYTLKSCKEISSKYKTRGEWAKNDASSYNTAQRKGWLHECCANISYVKRGRKTSFTLEFCKEIASKYTSRNEWRKSDKKSLDYAYKKGWVDECCINMIEKKSKAKYIAIQDILKDDFFEINYIGKESLVKKLKYCPLGYYTLDLEIY